MGRCQIRFITQRGLNAALVIIDIHSEYLPVINQPGERKMSNTEKKTLADTAMLACLSISTWSATKQDKRVTGEVLAANHADAKAGRFNKNLLEASAIKPIRRIANDARTLHYECTLPWDDQGNRILKAEAFTKYSEDMREYRTDFEKEVSAFINLLTTYKRDAKTRLGDMFDPSDYPSDEEIRDKFQFETTVSPIADGSDWRVGSLDRQTMNALKSSHVDAINKRVLRASNDIVRRAYVCAGHMASRLAVFDNSGDDVKNPFRDSLVDNCRELAEMVPMLNIADDPDIDAIGELLKTLSAKTADELRTDADARKAVQAAAKEAADKLRETIVGEVPELPDERATRTSAETKRSEKNAKARAKNGKAKPKTAKPAPKGKKPSAADAKRAAARAALKAS